MGWQDWFKHPQFNPINDLSNWFQIRNKPNDGYYANGDPVAGYVQPSPGGTGYLPFNPNANSAGIPAQIGVGYGDNYTRPAANDPFAPDNNLSAIDRMMQQLLHPKGGIGNAEGAAAAAAYNPVFANLAAEKLAATRRGQKNQRDIKGAYKALAQDYRQQAAAEVKGHAKATKEQNKAFAKDTYETGDAYTKVKAESDAEAARLGQSGTSAQQLADTKIGLASAEAVDLQKYQQRMDSSAENQISKSQSNYMTRGAMIAPQAGAEQLNISKNKLEDVLLGLSKEEAQARLSQAAARLAAQSGAKSANSAKIGDFIGLTRLKMDLTDWQGADGSLDPSKLKGLNDSYKFGIVSGVPQNQMDAFMKAFQGDADINSGMYQDPMLKKQVKMTKEMKLSKLYTLAVQAGIGTVQARQMAEIYLRGV